MVQQVNNNIGIIGCGWLGLPLAKALLKNGFTVTGSTTNPQKIKSLRQAGIVPFLIHLQPQNSGQDFQSFLDVDLLIINIPPGRGSGSAHAYLDNLNVLRNEILRSRIRKIVFISSTSVYAENNNVQTEASNDFGRGDASLRMLKAERVFCNLPNRETTIIRMAGLIGPERHPGRFFAGKSNIPDGLVPVNLIHLDDCIGIIFKVVQEGLWNQIFNAAAPSHPSKMEFYDLASNKLYKERADFIAEKKEFKIVDSSKIISAGYQFKHPDLLEWLKNSHQY